MSVTIIRQLGDTVTLIYDRDEVQALVDDYPPAQARHHQLLRDILLAWAPEPWP